MDTRKHKSVYSVGVLAIRGFESAYKEFNATFSDFLTETAGKRFDPPIRFEIKPLNFVSLFSDTKAGLVDFIYVNPSAFSCIESEYEAFSLVSQVSRRKIQGNVYDLQKFGGVIAARSDNDAVKSIYDLKNKIIAAASISGLGSGQMQFCQMIEAGMDYINDPAQLVFTSNQGKVVNGVLSGMFDVGFVRTDQIERTKYPNGTAIDSSLLKIIDPLPSLSIDGEAFPFASSTPLYPEWNLAALTHVPGDVSREVQEAMLSVTEHAEIGQAIEKCNAIHDEDFCGELDFPQDFNVSARCDVTEASATIAKRARDNGRYSNWLPTLSYMQLRTMQEATGFIIQDPVSRVWRCVRSAELYDSVTCPEGDIKKSRAEVSQSCAEIGLSCEETFQCVCQPCFTPESCVDAVEMLGRCVPYKVLLPSIFVPFVVVFTILFFVLYSRKSAQIVKHAKLSAERERELNEFIAHEVRNPLSAAISACTFVRYSVQETVVEEADLRDIKEDLSIIDSSLRFIGDLIRSILDLHRANHGRLVLDEDSMDIKRDLFEPVASIIYPRDTNFNMDIECPHELLVAGDRLRLNQVLLNLARNSAKFVEEGFIRLRAGVVNNEVVLYVEDSGPGIPEDKQKNLFSKFQDSLDTLAQGTGVGLSLCKKVIDAMGGKIYLDPTYRSGVNGCPGARIVVNLKRPPLDPQEDRAQHVEDGSPVTSTTGGSNTSLDAKSGLFKSSFTLFGVIPDHDEETELPKGLKVLFCDDDRILRRQGVRAIQRVIPDADICEVASGEAALNLVSDKSFDLIFMDQYMTSHERTMLGTETVRAMRSHGVQAVICDLSANQLEDQFNAAGADAFCLKPFPCKEEVLYPFLTTLYRRCRPNLVDDEPSIKGEEAV